MSTERRLRITEGEWKATGHDAFMNGIPCTAIDAISTENGFDIEAPRAICYVVGDHFDEQGKANATLIADAGKTYRACDMLPSEILEKLRSITVEIQGAEVSIQRVHDQDHTLYAVVDLDDWRRILKTLNLK